MKIIWAYLKPFRKWLFLAMGLAAIAQILEHIDPIFFGNSCVNIYKLKVCTDGAINS